MKHILHELFTFKLQPGPGFCWVKGCRKEGHSRKFHLCHAHYQHAWRMTNNDRSAYATLRDHARARKIPFTITHDYFQGLTDAYGYFKHEGPGQLTIDRVDAARGYEPGNLRVISLSANVAKGNRERWLPAVVQDHLRRHREKCQELLAREYEPF